MLQIIRPLSLISAICFSIHFHAVATTFNPSSITEKMAIQRFLQVSPDIQIAQTNQRATENAIKTARGSFFPNVNLVANKTSTKTSSAIYGSSAAETTAYTAQIEVTQPIYNGGALWAAYDYAKTSSAISKTGTHLSIQNGVANLLSSIYRYHFTQKKLQSLLSFQQQQKKFLEIAKRKAQRGNAKSYELKQAMASYLSYPPRIQALHLSLKALRYELQRMLDWNHNFQFSIAAVKNPFNRFHIDIEKLTRNSRILQNEIFKQRDEVIHQEYAVELAKTQKKLNTADHMPSLSFAATKGYQAKNTSDLSGNENEAYTYALSLNIPVFSGLSSIYQRRYDSEKIKEAKIGLARTKDNIVAELKSNLSQFKLQNQLLTSSKSWRDEAQEAKNLAKNNYRSGKIDSLQMQQVLSAFETAELSYIDSQLAHYLALLRLKKSFGLRLAK